MDSKLMTMSKRDKLSLISEIGEAGDANRANEIAAFLNDHDLEVLSSACFNLGYLGAREYISSLASFLSHDDDDGVANMCLSGLALIVDEREEYLLGDIYNRLDSTNSLLVKLSSIEAIGAIGSVKSVEKISRIFETDERNAVRIEIVIALGKIKSTSALSLLESYLKEVKMMDKNIPNRGGVRGGDPHPTVIIIALENSIDAIKSVEK
ncbi:HEAT repeat domain-containing protein [Hahella sp. HN01]|uniref:HEAT repeat domain-containing protein n=1 Tax=Hahella sp. HN01 TaxID=2847262 RepID=UPI001C1EF044|nr:HEAT repeat domain-containing protein [Hahella sp. HN01]MBU6956114.1 HEAT repeat domain-containing protein [Hahella sp. HN01]